MRNIFFEIINNSITASFLIAAVIVLRMILKRAPKWSICLLWAMVGIRLVMPFEIESRFSLLPDMNLLQVENSPNNSTDSLESEQKDGEGELYIQHQQNLYQNENQQIIPQNQDDSNVAENGKEADDKSFSMSRIQVAFWVWLLGSFVLVFYAVLSFWKLKQKIAVSIPLHDNIYLCDDIESPFVMGIFKPCIYLTSKIPQEAWDSILKHEYAHIKRADHIWKLLGYALLVIYWFNPLSWIAYILFCRDMELACDEKATKGMDKNQRATYCKALLTCNSNRKKVDVCPVAFGEVGVKERIKEILNYKKPSFWMILLAVVVCVVVSVCFMTSPNKEREDTENRVSVSDTNINENGQEKIENITEYDSIEDTYRVSNEYTVYEFGDLDNNGVEEYGKIYELDTKEGYVCHILFFMNDEVIYDSEVSYKTAFGDARYLDLDEDGEKEIFLTFWPNVNSMPLVEYMVLKQKSDLSWESLEMIHGETMMDNAFPISVTKGKNEWEAVISCEGLEKTVIFDLKFYYSKLMELWEKAETDEKDYYERLGFDYEKGFPEESEWYTFGSVCAWGIWNIKSGEYQGKPCLIATHGIQGYDKFDFWGELDVYFDYDAQGKTRFLDMEFRNSETWAGTTQQVKVELDLPDSLKLGNYKMDLTLGQGCLFEGDYEEQTHGDGTPEDWYAPGGIEFIKKEYFPGEVRFENGKLTEVSVLMNHSGIASDFEVIEGCDMQAVLCEYFCDLFTAAEAEEYMQEHRIAYEEFLWSSGYWYVFFAEEDSEYVYTLMLNQKYFEKEDIVELAQSVKFKVK